MTATGPPARRSGERPASPSLCVVVPCFNEESVLRETHARLSSVFERVPHVRAQIVYVDDGSTDGTMSVLDDLHRRDDRVRVVALSRNFGHQVALTAGLEHAEADAVVVIDADLQDPPEVIVDMLARWEGGADVVYGVRDGREGETVFKLWTARTFYRLINRVSDVPIPVDSGDFRLLDRTVVDAVRAMPERDRFVRGMVAWVGYRQEPVHYRRAPRFAGRTKYPLKRMVGFAVDGVLSFSRAPLRLAISMGLAVSALSMVGVVFAVAWRLLTEAWVPGWTLLFIAVMFLGGVQLVFLGVIGEYVGRIYGEVKARPLYLVRERLGFEARDGGQPAPATAGEAVDGVEGQRMRQA